MKPQEPIPHNYSIPTLNKIFAASALGLLMITGVLVVYDYVKGWKRFQLTFLRLEEQRIKADLKAAQDAQDRAELAKLDREQRVHEVNLARHREQYRQALASLDQWEGRHYAADQDYRFAKAKLDATRYEVEVAKEHRARGWEARENAYRQELKHLEVLKLRLEEVTRDRDAAAARADFWMKDVEQIESKRKDLASSIERLNKQLATVEANPNFFVLNAPLLDFISPTLKIDQVVLNDLFIDLNYMHAPRVDRCTTCHRAIDRPGFESRQEASRIVADLQAKLEGGQIQQDRIADTRLRIDQLKRISEAPRNLKNPYRTHPHLETFVGSASPHPMTDFGCTSCHRGLDRATDFARAGHSPSDEHEEKKWKKDYSWASQPFLETPMHPRQHLQASCLKCHAGQVTVPGAPDLTRATTMVEYYGCHACHKINNWRFSNLRRPGPDLNGIAEKTTPEWAVRWISNPYAFRPTTRMPAPFYQRNMIGPAVDPVERRDNIARQNTEIHSIVAFLFSRSSRRQWQPGPAGDVRRGQQLVNSIGCLGCHIAQDAVKQQDGTVRVARRDDFPVERLFGFNLVGTGTKTNSAWLYNWLKDPRHYYAEAPMPSLRLDDQEAADIAAWLMSLQKPRFMEKPVAAPDPKTIAALTKSYLVNTLSDREANEKLRAMPMQEQLVYLGERSIEKYGCYSCHAIKGFENTKPIGTELTTEGSKTLHLFDFGFVHEHEVWDGSNETVHHTVPSWIYNKLRSPRVWDDGREKTYHEKLKMPNYYLSKKEAELITSVIVGLTKDRVAEKYLASMSPAQRASEEGRKAISQHNCRGCHVVERHGRAIAQTIEDPGMLPPDLTPEGARVQSPWLFNFIKDPTVMTMRPWLKVRMPTFHLNDHEANLIVQGFAAEGNVTPFETTRFIQPEGRNVAVGQAVFEMMRCAQCHQTAGGVSTAEVKDAASLAPPLELSRARLQHDWIPDWIRRPNEIIPGTRMPTNFPRDPDTGHFTSPLASAINTPAFAGYKSRLMPHFATEDELTKTLADVDQLTNFIRDYIWTIGSPDMPAARPTEAPSLGSPAVRPTPAPAPGARIEARGVATRGGSIGARR